MKIYGLFLFYHFWSFCAWVFFLSSLAQLLCHSYCRITSFLTHLLLSFQFLECLSLFPPSSFCKQLYNSDRNADKGGKVSPLPRTLLMGMGPEEKKKNENAFTDNSFCQCMPSDNPPFLQIWFSSFYTHSQFLPASSELYHLPWFPAFLMIIGIFAACIISAATAVCYEIVKAPLHKKKKILLCCFFLHRFLPTIFHESSE